MLLSHLLIDLLPSMSYLLAEFRYVAILHGRNRELSHKMHFIPSHIEELTNKYPFATIYPYRNKRLRLFDFCHVTNLLRSLAVL